MKKFYNLTNDYLFKQIFRDKKYLKRLLKDFFDVNAHKIKYLNTELIKDNFLQKAGIVDLLLEVDEEIVILELQNINRYNFEERLLFYSSNIISKYCLESGKDYIKIKPIKVYSIINYDGLNDNFKDKVNLKKENKLFTKKLEYQIFDLTKANSEVIELISLFTQNNIEVLNKMVKDKTNKEMLEKMKKFNLDEKEYKKMEDIVEMLRNETEHYETAEEVGIIKGENKKSMEIAKNLLKQNIDINVISQTTGLSIEEINDLR